MLTQISAAEETAPFLEAADISKRYAGVQALAEAGLTCYKGETHVLIGENGAGKSTLVKIICGVAQRDSGEIRINGLPVDIKNSQDAQRNGIAAVFQELSLIQDLSVAENIFLGNEPANRFGRIRFKKIYTQAAQFLAELGLELNPRSLVRDLSLCDKQLVEIAKAIHKQPEILILDEATSALGEKEVKWLFDLMEAFTKQQNKAVIFISHRMDELHQVADRATIFRDARYIMSFLWGELGDEEIVEHISGKKQARTQMKKSMGTEGEYALEVEAAYMGTALNDINFKLKKGEILGVAGLSGHGQSDLLHSLFGYGTLDTGRIRVNGKPVRIRNERDALRNGIALVPEDRKNDGLILSHSVGFNITLMALEKIQKLGIFVKELEQRSIEDSVNRMSIKVHDVNMEASSLSGGNQQKVVIAKVLLAGARVILLSDPTRGIDIGTKAEIYKLMSSLAEEGYSILFYSTEVTELPLMCNRVIVLYEGHIAKELVGDEVTEKNIIAQSIGIGGVYNEA